MGHRRHCACRFITAVVTVATGLLLGHAQESGAGQGPPPFDYTNKQITFEGTVRACAGAAAPCIENSAPPEPPDGCSDPSTAPTDGGADGATLPSDPGRHHASCGDAGARTGGDCSERNLAQAVPLGPAGGVASSVALPTDSDRDSDSCGSASALAQAGVDALAFAQGNSLGGTFSDTAILSTNAEMLGRCCLSQAQTCAEASGRATGNRFRITLRVTCPITVDITANAFLIGSCQRADMLGSWVLATTAGGAVASGMVSLTAIGFDSANRFDVPLSPGDYELTTTSSFQVVKDAVAACGVLVDSDGCAGNSAWEVKVQTQRPCP